MESSKAVIFISETVQQGTVDMYYHLNLLII